MSLHNQGGLPVGGNPSGEPERQEGFGQVERKTYVVLFICLFLSKQLSKWI